MYTEVAFRIIIDGVWKNIKEGKISILHSNWYKDDPQTTRLVPTEFTQPLRLIQKLFCWESGSLVLSISNLLCDLK